MTWTKAQVRDLALRQIGVLGTGQTASAEDATIMESALDRVFADLTGRAIIPGRLSTFTLATVPDNLAQGFAQMAGASAASEFSLSGERLAQATAGGVTGEREIRAGCQKLRVPPDQPTGTPVYGDDDYTGQTTAVFF